MLGLKTMVPVHQPLKNTALAFYTLLLLSAFTLPNLASAALPPPGIVTQLPTGKANVPRLKELNSPRVLKTDSDTLNKIDALLKRGQAKAATALAQSALATHPIPARLILAQIATRQWQYALAQRHLEDAIRLAPNNASLQAQLGYLFYRWAKNPYDGRPELEARSMEFLEQAERLDSTNREYRLYHGLIALENGQTLDAKVDLEKAQTVSPNDVEIQQAQVLYHMRVGDYRQAKETLMMAVELEPLNPDSDYLMAQLLAKAGHADTALTYARKSRAQDYGKNPKRDAFIASLHEKLGQLQEASEAYETLLTYNPRHVPTLMKLGELAQKLQQPELSQSYIQQAISIDPDILTRLQDNTQQAFRQGNTTAGLAGVSQLLTLAPDQTAAHRALVVDALYYDFLFRKTTPAQAQQWRSTFHDTLDAPDTLQDSATQLDNVKLAIVEAGKITQPLQAQLDTLSASPDAMVAGQALFLRQRYMPARDKFDALDGQTPEGYLGFGERLFRIQALYSARVMLQRGQQAHPTPETSELLKKALQRVEEKMSLAQNQVLEANGDMALKNYPGALRKYTAAQSLYPEWDIPYVKLALLHEAQKRWPESLTAYKKAVELNPIMGQSPDLQKKLTRLEKRVLSTQQKSAQQKSARKTATQSPSTEPTPATPSETP